MAGFGLGLAIWMAIGLNMAPGNFGRFVLAGFIAWLGFAILSVVYPRCRVCRTSVFVWYKRWWGTASAPWPRRRCCKCGADLTAS